MAAPLTLIVSQHASLLHFQLLHILLCDCTTFCLSNGLLLPWGIMNTTCRLVCGYVFISLECMPSGGIPGWKVNIFQKLLDRWPRQLYTLQTTKGFWCHLFHFDCSVQASLPTVIPTGYCWQDEVLGEWIAQWICCSDHRRFWTASGQVLKEEEPPRVAGEESMAVFVHPS